MTPSGAERSAELQRLARELPTLTLLPSDWDAIGSALGDVADGRPGSVERLSQIAFEARVARQFSGGRTASTLPPTKKMSALPWVGLVCGVLLLAVGGALGGGVVLAGVAALSIGVFAVAFAGSRVAHRGRGRGEAKKTAGPESVQEEEPEPAPIPEHLEARLAELTTMFKE